MFMDRLLGPWVLEPCLNSILHSMKHIIIYYIKKRKVTESFSSVQFSCSVMSESLQPHGLQHTRPPCPSPIPGGHSNSRPSSLWCHPAISSSIVPFSSCPNSSQPQSLFQWVNSSHEVAKVLEFQLCICPSNEPPGLVCFRMDWLDLPEVQRTLNSLLQHHSSKASILWCSAFFMVHLSHPSVHDYWKSHNFDYPNLCQQNDVSTL